MKWAVIAVAVMFALLAIFEVARRSGGNSEPAGPGFGETGTGAAVAEHLRGGAWEKPESGSAPANPELDRADAIVDSREQSLDEAKGKTQVFIKAIQEN